MSNAKPIAVIKVDTRCQPEDMVHILNDNLREMMPDYYVFVIPNMAYDRQIATFEFEVYYEKNWVPVNWEEMKELIMNNVPSQTKNIQP